jgi:hypothetical protein
VLSKQINGAMRFAGQANSAFIIQSQIPVPACAIGLKMANWSMIALLKHHPESTFVEKP